MNIRYFFQKHLKHILNLSNPNFYTQVYIKNVY